MSKKMSIRDKMNPMKRSNSTSKLGGSTTEATSAKSAQSTSRRSKAPIDPKSKRESAPNFKIYRATSAGNKRESIDKSSRSGTSSNNSSHRETHKSAAK